jgi:hypothetical protein
LQEGNNDWIVDRDNQTVPDTGRMAEAGTDHQGRNGTHSGERYDRRRKLSKITEKSFERAAASLAAELLPQVWLTKK